MKRIIHTIFFCAILITVCTKAFSQVTITSSDSVNCTNACTTLTATLVGLTGSSAGLSTADDSFSAAIPIGFTFKFYGINYTQCVIGTNGELCFDLANAGQYNTWDITTTLALSATSTPDIHNLIAGPWCDLYLAAGGSVKYSLVGTAPFRKFEVTFCGDHMYQCTTQFTTSQIIIYESSNIAEVHIGHKTLCSSWDSGYAIIGVVNQNGTACTTAPGRDYPSMWTTTDEAWRFTPNSGGTAYTVTSIPYAPVPFAASTIYWYNANTGAYINSGNSINVCPTTTTTYKAGALGCLDTTYGYYTVTVATMAAPITRVSAGFACTGSTMPLSDATPGGTWSSSNTSVATIDPSSGLLSGVSTGNTIITYALSSGCFSTTNVAVYETPPPITGITPVCVGSSITVSDSLSAGEWSSGSPGIATITFFSGVVTGITAGNAIITYTNGIPAIPTCFTTASVTVLPLPPAITGPASVCTGSTIILSDAISGGTWSSGNTAAATIVTSGTGSGTVSGIAAGTTIITYTTAGGCFATATVTVIRQPTAITGITHVCTGSTTTLSDAVTGGTWASALPGIATMATATPPTGIVYGAAAGVAVITYTTGGTCIATTSVTVNQTPHAITGPASVCTGSTIALSDSPTGGTWTSSNSSAATITSAGGVVTGVTAGTTAITYTLTGNCTATTSVTVYTAPSAILGPTHVCTGLTITLSDMPAGGTWHSGTTSVATVTASSGIVTGVNAGIALVTYTTIGNCIATTSITVNFTPTITAGSPNICTDGSTFVAALLGSGVWSLSNTSVATITTRPPDSATVSGIRTGTTVVAYALLGCSTTYTINAVSILPPITGPAYVCTGQSVSLSDIIIGGTWASTNTAVATVDEHAGVVVGISPGVPTISYTIGGTCITTTTITVHQSPNHGIITGDTNVCVGQMIILSDSVTLGVWGMSNDSATISHDTVTGMRPGIDTAWYIVHNAFCTDTATRPITIYPVPIAGQITGRQTLCVGLTITLSDTAAGGVWSSQTTTIATITQAALVTGISAGNDSIKYTVTNPGCSSVATYTVSVYNVPVPGMITGHDKVCAGGQFVLNDTTGGVWTSNNTAVATIGNLSGNVSALNTGVTIIHYTIGPNAGRCFGIATYTLTVTPQNTLTIGSTVTQISCNGAADGSIAITMSGGTPPLYYKYQWSDGDTTPTITGLAPGYDTILVTEPSTLCMAMDTFQITQPDSLLLSDTTTQDICKQGNGTVATMVTGGTQPYTYLWSDNSTGDNLEHLHAGSYTVTVTDHNGCTQTAIAQVTDNDCGIVIHDAITPNGDGINDTWVIEGLDNYPTNTVQLFDKWGDMVYEKTNYNNDFNGRGKNGELPDGTYYYLVKLNTTNLLGGKNT